MWLWSNLGLYVWQQEALDTTLTAFKSITADQREERDPAKKAGGDNRHGEAEIKESLAAGKTTKTLNLEVLSAAIRENRELGEKGSASMTKTTQDRGKNHKDVGIVRDEKKNSYSGGPWPSGRCLR